MKKIDLTGQKFSYLTVIEEDLEKSTPGNIKWKCRCDCGNIVTVKGGNLKSGNTTSCGCNHRKICSEMLKQYNRYDLTGEYGIGYDNNGKTFTFDLDDYDLIKNYCWNIHKEYRKKSNGEQTGVEYYVTGFYRDSANNKRRMRLHRLIMGVVDTPEVFIDHIDGNGCNNQKSNLRICTCLENAWNVKPRKNTSSKYKGVYYHSQSRKWQARINKNKKAYYLGLFETEEAAAEAYNNAATELFGEFARLNEIHYDNEIKEAI